MKVLIIGSGLGSLSTALRLTKLGYEVTILEKYHRAGGRLNLFEKDGFKFDLGPSFMSMTYELDELFNYCEIKNPIKLIELEPLYKVYFENRKDPYNIFKDLDKLQKEFSEIEPNFKIKAEKYLKKASEFFHDTEDKVIKKNFDSILRYLVDLTKVPPKHLPFLVKTIWSNIEKYFESHDVRVIFSLIAFFLGATPFNTPAIYSILNYTEMQHNGYWKIEGGMYKLVEELVKLLSERGVKFVYNTEIVNVDTQNHKINFFIDNYGNKWKSDIYVVNSDAAFFRGKVLNRKVYSDNKLDKMKWTLAPFTIYLGIDKKVQNLSHHNYFLGSNFKGYADKIFTSSINPQKPYYYVNVPSVSYNEYAPKGKESIFILCPVPDLRYKSNWDDKNELADNIINDLEKRIDENLRDHIILKEILTPKDWMNSFNLYRGSGLGLAHNIMQVGAFRPKNKDEKFNNLYYVGASTIPGTGLPMVIISSRLVTERILDES